MSIFTNTLFPVSSLRRLALLGLAGTAAVVAPSVSHAAFASLGAEYRVSTANLAPGNSPAVFVDGDGESAVVYAGTASGTDGDVYIRRYDANGTARSSDIRVNTVTAGQQKAPDIAGNASGAHVVVWESVGQDGSGSGIYAQRYNAAGSAVGSPIPVNQMTSGDQRNPAVAMDANGNFVVGWIGTTGGNSYTPVRFRRFNANGAPLSNEATAIFDGPTLSFDLGMDARGNFAFVTSQGTSGTSHKLFYQLFNAGGSQVKIDQLPSYGDDPAIGMAPNGTFVITWSGFVDNGAQSQGNVAIIAQRFAATGSILGNPVRVNAYDYEAQIQPDVSRAANGDYVITWSTPYQDGSGLSVYGRRYSAGGLSQGGEFLINQITQGDQAAAAVGVDSDGDFVVAWENRGGANPYSQSVAARRFRGDASINLAATMAADRSQAAAGQTVNYTATISNLQPTQTSTGVASIDATLGAALKPRIRIDLPANSTLVSPPITDVPGTCTTTDGLSYLCTLSKPLPAATSARASFSVRPNGGGNLVTKDSIGTDSSDPVAANNADQVTVNVLTQ